MAIALIPSLLSAATALGGLIISLVVLHRHVTRARHHQTSMPDNVKPTASFSGNQPAGNGQIENLALLQELQTAIDCDRLALEYQPKLDLRGETILSAEALLRWHRLDGTLAHTGDLIELVEKTSMIEDLTMWVVGQAISDSEKYLDAGFSLCVFVNISAGLLSNRAFVERLIAAVKETDALIGIEITETAVIAKPDKAIANLQLLAAEGVVVAIDDFGVGLSSLEYLQQLPASELKIDRNFIAKLSSSNRNPLIVKATIDLAHALEMKVTAEGVDDPLSLSLLRVMGCDMAQGYLISRPLSLPEMLEYLKSGPYASCDPEAQRAASA